MSVATWLGAAAFGACVLTGCGSSGRKFSARPSLLEPARPLEQEVSPAEWRYHPRQSAPLARSYGLAGGKTLFVGGLGERWLVDGQRDRAQPASMLAPESLVGALGGRNAPWVFVGQSGTTYEADSPIGPLLSSNGPLERFARVDAGTNNVLGVSRDGQLMLSEDAGSSWLAVGPPGARFSDVLLSPPYGAALEVPERLWWSATEGRQWQPLDVPPFGAERLTRDKEAGPVVVSALGVRSIRFDRPPQLVALGRVVVPDQPELNTPPLEGPSAKALASGRAFVHRGRYFELALGARAQSLSGERIGTLTRRSEPLFSACDDVEVGGFDRWVYAACTRERTGTVRSFDFFRSEDGGRSFKREAYVARGNPDDLRLAVGHGGALLVTGLCLPHEALSGCRPQGIQERREGASDAGVGVELHAVPVPALEENALALAFSTDGQTAYAVGHRTKSDAVYVFVSTDLSRGFAARPIAHLTELSAPGPSRVHALTAASDGQVSLVLSQSSGPYRLVLLDAGARTLSVNAAPLDGAAIGAYGHRALAVSVDEGWESLNGGADWESIGRLPSSACSAAASRCAVPIECDNAGCTIGDTLSRVGWRGQSHPTLAMLPPAPSKSSAGTTRAVGPLWSCELSGPEWRELSGVESLPDARQAAIGKAAWFALSTDDVTAAAGLWIAEVATTDGERGPRVRYSELLSPTERASDVAYRALLQVEGAAALRYKIPGTPGASKAQLTNVEVAWANLLEHRHGRGLIADAGGQLPGDVVKGEGMARRARSDLLSISNGGIYVRVHANPQHDQISYFLDGSTVEEVPPLRWSPPAPKESSSEMARVGRTNVPLLFVNQGTTVVRARRQLDGWQFDAMSVGFADVDTFAIWQNRDIAYTRGQAGIHLTTRWRGAISESRLFPLEAEGRVLGAAIPVPTQADLNDRPSACTARQRADSPRVIAPLHPGRRRPILVHDAVEPLRVLLTDAAVLYGTPDSACAEAFDAELVKLPAATAATRERALLSLSGPSWLFRVAPDNTRRDVHVEYRTMSCKLDPGVDVPPEVYEMPGTRSDG